MRPDQEGHWAGHDVPRPLPAMTPAPLVSLRTRGELHAALATVDVYTLPLPAHSAHAVVSALRAVVSTNDLQHLRRVVRPSTLPATVRARLPTTGSDDPTGLQLLVCAVSGLPQDQLLALLSTLAPFETAPPPMLTILPVPCFSPASPEQAAQWSAEFWPVVYKGGNPFGPHPPTVRSTERRLQRASEYISLARAAGAEAAQAGVGIGVGAVIIHPRSGEVMAVAGDARKCAPTGRMWANPLDHVVMRAVAMVAQKRLPEGAQVVPDNPIRPVTALEKQYFKRATSPEPMNSDGGGEANGDGDAVGDGGGGGGGGGGNGYLCHNMHVYLSHEPCVMCAMALLHSRVGVVVFAKRMQRTGALTADAEGLGHGLFWRPELNWKYICWQWQDEVENIDVGEEVSV